MGSALHGWGFTLNTFARMYASKFKIEHSKMILKLWGDNFFNAKKNKWQTEPEVEGEDQPLPRGFCALVLDPIIKLANAVLNGKKDVYEPIIKKINVELKGDDLDLVGKNLLRKVMQKWINASDALLEMMILHLPSPKIAQKYRTLYLYEGPMDDECAKAMINCDPNGPLMMFISKLIPTSDNGRFYAFGRVFSGTVSVGKKVRILGQNYKHGRQEDLYEKNVQRVVLMMGRKAEDVADVPCGNTCALLGVDQCILKQGTITDNSQGCTIKCMKYSVSPVVRVAIKPKNPSDLPKLVEGLKKMSQSDPLVQVISTETEQIICGCGELHIEICLKDLVDDYSGIEIIKSDPVVPYKETVTATSNQTCLSKSPNKHNRLYMVAEPLHEDLTKEIEDGTVKSSDDVKVLSRKLIDVYEWDQHDSRKVWCFGPENTGPNIVVDQTKAVQYLTEIKDSMESAFQWVTKEGVIAEEALRGCRFNILDVELHADAVHRGINNILNFRWWPNYPNCKKSLLCL
jgi:elongation factor 2